MAKIIFTKSGKEVEVADGASLTGVAEANGVMFGCYTGVCGTCIINIASGAENLSERTEFESNLLGDDQNLRLACQCRIIKGEVRIDG